ncbi:MAG: glycosyltransferase family 9 protein [Kiloniellales bacterium]
MQRNSIAIYSCGELIGDATWKLPVLRAARSLFPEHHICWLTSSDTVFATRLRPLVEGLLDEVTVCHDLARGGWDLIRPLPLPQGFEILIDTQSNLLRSLVVRRIPHRLYLSTTARFLLSDRRPPWPYRKPAHQVHRLLLLLELAAGRTAAIDRVRLPVPQDFASKAARLLPPGRRYLGLAPGAGSRNKCWPLERFIEVAAWHRGQGGVPVFILGPNELEWLPRIKAALPEALFPEQESAVWGEGFSPIRTIALAERLTAAVANDAGVGHMLAAADIPLLTLFGPTNAEKFRPLISRGEVLAAESYGGQDPALIPTAAVIERVAALLDS